MVYLIIDTNLKDRTMLVKAKDRDEVKARLNLKDTQRIVASFTDADIAVLNDSGFTVISS